MIRFRKKVSSNKRIHIIPTPLLTTNITIVDYVDKILVTIICKLLARLLINYVTTSDNRIHALRIDIYERI